MSTEDSNDLFLQVTDLDHRLFVSFPKLLKTNNLCKKRCDSYVV